MPPSRTEQGGKSNPWKRREEKRREREKRERTMMEAEIAAEMEGTILDSLNLGTCLIIADHRPCMGRKEGLTGGLHASIGRLSKLENLLLTGCSLSGEIPQEIGSLSRLVYLSLDYNSFTGSIPPTIGCLSKLYVLDLTYNELTETIPISDGLTPVI